MPAAAADAASAATVNTPTDTPTLHLTSFSPPPWELAPTDLLFSFTNFKLFPTVRNGSSPFDVIHDNSEVDVPQMPAEVQDNHDRC